MKTVLIDDEPLPLMQLTKLLQPHRDHIQIIATYRNAARALEEVPALAPDVIFLDIHMPGINGLALAAAMQEALPSVEIVFVTAYDRYAVQAFELFALDYVMKPLQTERLDKTVERLKARFADMAEAPLPAPGVTVHSFKRIAVEQAGGTREPLKWRTAKAQELFACLLHHYGKFVSSVVLIEMLWPELEFERGTQLLYSTIYYVRKTLQNAGLAGLSLVSMQHQGGYSLQFEEDTRHATADWERRLKELPPPDDLAIVSHEALLEQYEGDYLGDYDYLWAISEQERLRQLWLGQAQSVSDWYAKAGDLQSAVRVNRHVQKICPYEEISYFELMKLYAALHHPLAVEEQYRQLALVLDEELNVQPSAAVTSWYRKWKAQTTV